MAFVMEWIFSPSSLFPHVFHSLPSFPYLPFFLSIPVLAIYNQNHIKHEHFMQLLFQESLSVLCDLSPPFHQYLPTQLYVFITC